MVKRREREREREKEREGGRERRGEIGANSSYTLTVKMARKQPHTDVSNNNKQ